MPTPYLTFDGDCAEAFAAYASVFNGEIRFQQTFGVSPMKDSIPEEFHGRIMHATLALPSGLVMGSDTGPWAPHAGPMRSCHLSVPFTDLEEASAAFEALSEGGEVTMPFAKTFWADGFGMLVDRFKVAWMLNCGG